VAAMVNPPVFPDKGITMMMAELMHWFVMLNFNRMRWKGFMFWGSFCAGDTQDAGYGYNS
jgi:hypothetical protein